MKREDLTLRQQKVLTADGDVVLVLGGPGTGKTTTALWAAEEALGRSDVAPWQKVLFLTFSRTAVAQIARTAPGVFGASQSRIEIATFHGLAWRLIRAFGRYDGHGAVAPALQSEARAKLLGRDATRLAYQDLIPAARKLLKSERVLRLIASRWPLVICDEFQDTNDEQWALLAALGSEGRLLLLCDPNQMIYTFLAGEGVGPERLEQARQLADDIIELEPHSHRDPSNIIPKMAQAIRKRQFSHNDVLEAVRRNRLTILPNIIDEDLTEVIASQVGRLRGAGAKSIGIFGHSNEGVSTLGAGLARSGLGHVLIGIPEAHAEALSALSVMCAYGVGLANSSNVRVALATFLTACTRGNPPELAVALARGTPLPPRFEAGVAALEDRLLDAGSQSMAALVDVASEGWKAIRITSGLRPWRRACPEFIALARRTAALPACQDHVQSLIAATQRRRPNALVEFDGRQGGVVQLMNFYQTKGREADGVLLVYRSGDYLANRRDCEPFEEASRVLFVSITRARQAVVVILPPDPHPLITPFIQLACPR